MHLSKLMFLAVALATAAWSGSGTRAGAPAASTMLPASRLITVDPLPDSLLDSCTTPEASTPERLRAQLWEARLEQQAAGQGAGARSRTLDRAPLRTIRDTYPTYSTVFVDAARNEILLQDENLFTISTFVRTTNTSPRGSAAEPKRRIGGLNTKIEFNSGLYVDPTSGDAYSISNDTVDTMVVFSRSAKGDVVPDRELETPHRTYAITANEGTNELFMTVQHPPEIIVYPKTAKGHDEPVRRIAGPQTLLQDPHGIALDTKNGLIYVSNHGHTSNPRARGGGSFELPSISIYPIDAKGDVAPVGVIKGAQTRLNWPSHVFFDEQAGELFVANDGDDSIVVFRGTDRGDVAPTRTIKGPSTGIKNPTGVFVDLVNQEVAVANMGNHTATIYPRTADGDVKPLRTIRSAPPGKVALAIGNPGAAAYDTKRGEVLVPN